MSQTTMRFYTLVMISAVFLMVMSTMAAGISGTVTVPQWNTGKSWGYEVPSYFGTYGIGFEVVGTETVNGHECYDVKIWWDQSYGSEDDTYDLDIDVPGFSYSYLYEGHAYLTTAKLAIAKFTMSLQMRMNIDGSKMMDYSGYTRAEEYDESDYMELYESMKKWRMDMDYSFDATQTYDPPFVMYDYPLSSDSSWTSTSTVTTTWSYSVHTDMNEAMEKDMQMLSDEDLDIGFDFDTDEEDSDTDSFTLSGTFDVVGEDSVTTDSGTFSVFEIDYDISASYTRGTRSTSDILGHGGVAAPGGDATMNLLGCGEGSGKSFFDPESGHPQKIETEGFGTETFETVDPTTIENTFSGLDAKGGTSSSDSDDEADNNMMLILGVVGIVVVIVIVVVVVVMSKKKKQIGRAPPPYDPYGPREPRDSPPPRDDYDRDRGYDDRDRGYDDRDSGYDDRDRGYDDRDRDYDDRDRDRDRNPPPPPQPRQQ